MIKTRERKLCPMHRIYEVSKPKERQKVKEKKRKGE